MKQFPLPALPALDVETLRIEDLVESDRNARMHPEEHVDRIAASIEEFGFTVPVLLDSEGVIIAGHGRIAAARKLGIEAVPCIRLDHLSEPQARAYRIADNRLTELGGWDEGMLASELDALRQEGFAFALTGFDLADLERMLPKAAEWPDAPGGAEDGEAPLGEMIFTISEGQREVIDEALMGARHDKDIPKPDDNANPNAATLAEWARRYMGQRPKDSSA